MENGIALPWSEVQKTMGSSTRSAYQSTSSPNVSPKPSSSNGSSANRSVHDHVHGNMNRSARNAHASDSSKPP